jgi:hypothetical protein
MTIPGALRPDGPSWVPVPGCTLPTAAQPLRVAELDELFADALTEVRRLGGDRVRLVMLGGPELAGRVQDLVDRETRCCSFFTFTVTAGAGDHTTVVDIAVPADRADVLAALAERASAHLQRRGCR